MCLTDALSFCDRKARKEAYDAVMYNKSGGGASDKQADSDATFDPYYHELEEGVMENEYAEPVDTVNPMTTANDG